jgi:hypothetical protein
MVCGEGKNRNQKTTSARTGGTPERVACSVRVVTCIGLDCTQRESRRYRSVTSCGAIKRWIGKCVGWRARCADKAVATVRGGHKQGVALYRRCVYAIVKSTAEEVVFCQPVRIWQFVIASVGAYQKEERAPPVGIRKWHICTSQIARAVSHSERTIALPEQALRDISKVGPAGRSSSA